MTEVNTSHSARSIGGIWRALVAAELRVFARQPVMIALALLVPTGLLAITALVERAATPQGWAMLAGRNTAAVLCITVYFISLNTMTARRHTLALKRLRTTALPDVGIVTALLVPPIVVGTFQLIVLHVGLLFLGAPPPADPAVLVAACAGGLMVASLAGVVTSAFTANPEKAQWTMLPLFVSTMGAASVVFVVSEPLANLALRLVPIVASADAAGGAWLETTGLTLLAVDGVIVVAWAVLLGVVSWRTFRWERRR